MPVILLKMQMAASIWWSEGMLESTKRNLNLCTIEFIVRAMRIIRNLTV